MQFICDIIPFIYDVMQFICYIMQFIYDVMRFIYYIMQFIYDRCCAVHMLHYAVHIRCYAVHMWHYAVYLFCYALLLFYWALWMRHAPAFFRHVGSTLFEKISTMSIWQVGNIQNSYLYRKIAEIVLKSFRKTRNKFGCTKKHIDYIARKILLLCFNAIYSYLRRDMTA